ncbi:MAG TPA: T9SS type A sorting domain-containing protein [Bacteroidales bacterium]|nr:T9SS type A sorting domain-containing protein [Bacteroidales bacterium]HRX96245.1 T9SS type A sorting domain-containing protein [Bacteroidales bacterium]
MKTNSTLNLCACCISILIAFGLFIKPAKSISQEISTRAEIFDFEIGDIFHYTDSGTFGAGQEGYTKNIVDTITNKYYSENFDTIFYVVKRHLKEISSYNQYWTYQSYTYTKSVQNLDAPIHGGVINEVLYSVNYNGRIINKYHITVFYPPSYYPLEYRKTFKNWVEGCGVVLDRYEDYPFWCEEEFKLEYYKKGDEEWGTPLSVITSVTKLFGNSNIEIYPNPVQNELFINLSNSLSDFEVIYIFSLDGKLIRSIEIKSKKNIQIITSDFISGLYIIKLVSGEGIYVNKFLKR